MGRSLTSEKERKTVLEVDGYQVTRLSKGWAVEGVTRDTAGRKWSLREEETAQWLATWNSSDAKRVRLKIKAATLDHAVEQSADRLFGHPVEDDPEEFRIGNIFALWKSTLTVTERTANDYQRSVERFLGWLPTQPGNLMYWGQLRMQHCETYLAALDREGYGYHYLYRLVQPIKQASRWAAKNWPERFNHWGDVSIKKRASRKPPRHTVALTLEQIGEWVVAMFDKAGHSIIPGVVIQGLASARLEETFRMTWEDVDLETGVLHVKGQKTALSDRLIPLPRFAVETLAWFKGESDGTGRILNTFNGDWRNYAKAVHKAIQRRFPGLSLEPKGLRRSLPSQAFREGFYGPMVQLYRGHVPEQVSGLDWNHYLVHDPVGLLDRMREQVVAHIDDRLKPFDGYTAALPANVVPLKTGSDPR